MGSIRKKKADMAESLQLIHYYLYFSEKTELFGAVDRRQHIPIEY